MKLLRVAQIIGAQCPDGVADLEITGISTPEKAEETDITFLSDQKYAQACESCKSKVIIVKNGITLGDKICLQVKDPYLGYALIAQQFEDHAPAFGAGIHAAAIVDPSATIHPSVSIGPCSVIGANVTVAEGTRIEANCVIEKNCTIGSLCRIDSGATIRWGCILGNRVIIQSGAVIGSDGFGNAMEGARYVRIPAFGVVVLEDDVDIGANTTIDRGNFNPTYIARGVKIDNLVHLAHNVKVGEDTAIVAQVGISGSTVVGNRVVIAGQAGFVGHIEIGDGAFIGAKAGVSKSVEPGAKITGYPARDFMTMRRIEAAQASLPSLLKEMKQLKQEIAELKRGS
jgi:UDP-3-O-[3-hydroxymyristoyl] glucosamine N-acyltransferase